MEICCGTPEKIRNIIEQYRGEEFQTINMEILKRDIQTLYNLSEFPCSYEASSLWYVYILVMENANQEGLIKNFTSNFFFWINV